MSNFLRKVVIGFMILALGVSIGILYETIKYTLYPEIVSVTLYDAEDCDIKSVEIQSKRQRIFEYVGGTAHYDNYTVHYYSKSGQISKYSISVSTENCGEQKGVDRNVYPGQVIYEKVGKDGINLQIRH